MLEISELRLGLSYCVVAVVAVVAVVYVCNGGLFLYYFAAAAKFRILSSNNSATSACKSGSLIRW